MTAIDRTLVMRGSKDIMQWAQNKNHDLIQKKKHQKTGDSQGSLLQDVS